MTWSHILTSSDQWLALDIISELAFGISTDLLNNTNDRFVLDLLHIYTWKLGVVDQWPNLNWIGLETLASKLLPSTSKDGNSFEEWLTKLTSKAIANNTSATNGLMAPVVQAGEDKNPKGGHDKSQMLAEGCFVTFTGSDGIGTSLSGIQHYLAHCPRVYQKLARELRSKFAPGAPIEWGPDLASCTYLAACMQEAWRMLPPSCGPWWRECEASEIRLSQGPIPAGCDIGLSLPAISRDERYFRQPLEFWPERWVPGELPEAELALAKKAFIPFALGPRSCTGMHVAEMVLNVSVAYLMVNYDFKIEGATSPVISEAEGRFLTERLEYDCFWALPHWESGPRLQFRKRAPPAQ